MGAGAGSEAGTVGSGRPHPTPSEASLAAPGPRSRCRRLPPPARPCTSCAQSAGSSRSRPACARSAGPGTAPPRPAARSRSAPAHQGASPVRGQRWVAAPTALCAASLAHWRPLRAASPEVGSQHGQPQVPRSSVWAPLCRGHGQWSHTAFPGWGLPREAAGPVPRRQRALGSALDPEAPSGSHLAPLPGPRRKEPHPQAPQQPQAGSGPPCRTLGGQSLFRKADSGGDAPPRTRSRKGKEGNLATRTGGKVVNRRPGEPRRSNANAADRAACGLCPRPTE